VLDAVEVPVALVDRGGTIRATNRAWRAMAPSFGPSSGGLAKAVVGASFLDACRAMLGGMSHGGLGVCDGIAAVLAGESPSTRADLAYDLPHERRWLEISLRRAEPDRGEVVVSLIDISDRKRVEAMVAVQGHVLEQVATGHAVSDVLSQIAAAVEDQLSSVLCSIHTLDEDGQLLCLAAAPSLPLTFRAAIERMAIGPSAGSGAAACFLRHPVIVRDAADDPLAGALREASLDHGLRACWAYPLFRPKRAEVSEPRAVLGALVLYGKSPRTPDGWDERVATWASYVASLALELDRNTRALREGDPRLLRQAEQRTREELHQREQQYRLLADHIPHLVWAARADGTIDYLNPQAIEYTGLALRDSLAESFARVIHPDDLARIMNIWADGLRNQKPQATELRLRRADGEYRWHLTRQVGVRDAEGALICWFGTCTDIHDQRLLEEQYRQAQKMEAFGQLAGGVAHDFNNILSIVNAEAELLAEQLSPNDPRTESVIAIQDAGRRAAALTARLLSFSRKTIVEPRVLDLNEVVERQGALLCRLLGEDITLEIRLGEGLGLVKADAGQIEQVIMNLAINARDAMPKGGLLTIETHAIPVGGLDGPLGDSPAVRVSVSDTGTGMSAETRARIFEPFFTTKPVGKGTGIGLAMVHGIVSACQGKVEVESEVGRGSRFSVVLPVAAPSAVLPSSRPKPVAMLRGNETVLIVEDEPAVRRVLRVALEAQGYEVLEADGGASALRIVERSLPIHLLVTDVVMPGMGGREVAEEVVARHPEAAVLYISGYTDDTVVRNGVFAATDAFLQKPFTPRTLVEKVRELLDRRR
jgi:PAS domain S-box-containing protein